MESAARRRRALGALEQDAAAKAAVHANTPVLAYFDTLGRAFLTIADNAGAGQYQTHFDLDIQNYQRSVTDARDRKVVAYDYDMPGGRIHQASMEAGEQWMLNDVAGKSIRAWDSRGHNFRTAYDALRRPFNLFVFGADPANSDSRTIAGEVLFETIDYGEGQPKDQALNLRTRVFQHHDDSGVVINMVHDPVANQDVAYDFKGNLLRSSRQFVQDHVALPNWALAPPIFLPDVFVSFMQYDALNRIVAATAPDGSVIHPTYNEANLLEAVSVNLLAGAATQFVNNIDYNAMRQRVLIEYGDIATKPSATAYTYDPLTFRLARLTTTRPGFPPNQQTVQDLTYTYDPNGNITHIQDNADIQNVVFFNNVRIEPSCDYTYDAINRQNLARARELLGLSGGEPLAPTPTSSNDLPRLGLQRPGDGNAMGIYDEQYQYDEVGNFSNFIHSGTDPANPGWTRSYNYTQASQLEPLKFSNRLSLTVVKGSVPLNENYTYDLHGNMTSMPQLQSMGWDFKDQLLVTQRQAVNASDADGAKHTGELTYYVYSAAGERVRKTTQLAGVKTKERLYLGALEVYREYDGMGNITLERQTLNVMDDQRRIALVETKTVDNSVPPGSLPVATTRYQFGNHLGTACLELDENANVISYEEYYPYGSTSYQAGRTLAEVSLKRYRYIAKERDPETGFYYCSARYYAPWLGRWISTDPKGIAGGINLYSYSRENPVVLQDPGGQDPDAQLVDKAGKIKITNPAAPSPKDAGSSAGLQNFDQRQPSFRIRAARALSGRSGHRSRPDFDASEGRQTHRDRFQFDRRGAASRAVPGRARARRRSGGVLEFEFELAGAGNSSGNASPRRRHFPDCTCNWGGRVRCKRQEAWGRPGAFLESQAATSEDQSRQLYVNESVVHLPQHVGRRQGRNRRYKRHAARGRGVRSSREKGIHKYGTVIFLRPA